MNLIIKTVLILAAGVVAGTAQAWNTPRQALTNYLQFELSGGRFEDPERFKRYFYLSGSPWNNTSGAELVESYRIDFIRCPSTMRCTAKVTFKLLPTAGFTEDFYHHVHNPKGGRDSVRYTLHKGKEGWKLKEEGHVFEYIPRVTLTTFIQIIGDETAKEWGMLKK